MPVPRWLTRRDHVLWDTADIIIKKVGEEAYAIRTDTREVITHSKDLAQVIQAAINSLPIVNIRVHGTETQATGPSGRIYIAPGLYRVYSQVTIGSANIIIEGGKEPAWAPGWAYTEFNYIGDKWFGGTTIYFENAEDYDGTFLVTEQLNGRPATYLLLRHLEIRTKNPSTEVNGPVLNLNGLAQGGMEYVKILNDTFDTPNIRDGIFLQSGGYKNYVWLKYVDIFGFSYRGLYLNTSHIHMEYVDIGKKPTYGLVIMPTQRFTCIGYHAFYTGIGISVHGTLTDYDNIVFISPHFENTTTPIEVPSAAEGKGKVIFVNPILDGVTNLDWLKNKQITIVGDLTYRQDKTKRARDMGVATLSGDGNTTDFLIGTHNLLGNITDPSQVIVTCNPANPVAVASSPLVCYLSDEDNDGKYESIRVKFASAPPSGTDNVKIAWKVEYIG